MYCGLFNCLSRIVGLIKCLLSKIFFSLFVVTFIFFRTNILSYLGWALEVEWNYYWRDFCVYLSLSYLLDAFEIHLKSLFMFTTPNNNRFVLRGSKFSYTEESDLLLRWPKLACFKYVSEQEMEEVLVQQEREYQT